MPTLNVLSGRGRCAVVLLVLTVFVVVGCGPPPSQAVVRGSVVVAGKPLPGGLIGFHLRSDPDRWSAGRIDPDGTYLVPDAPIGPCAVTTDTAMLRGRRQPPPLGPVLTGLTPGGLPGGSGLEPQNIAFVAIDKKFSDKATSPLAAEVTGGENSIDFAVE